MKDAVLAGSHFRPLNNSYGIDRGYRQMYPDTIRIKFSEKHGDFATYKLERVGHKPV